MRKGQVVSICTRVGVFKMDMDRKSWLAGARINLPKGVP